MTDARELTKPRTSEPTDGDGDNVAHYVRKDDIVRGNVEGALQALKTARVRAVAAGDPTRPIDELEAHLRSRGQGAVQ